MKLVMLLFIIIPALEIWLLITAGNVIGAIPTIFLIMLTGIVGAYLAKQQGYATIRAAQYQLQEGIIPGDALLDGICILVGGVLLLTPGFITDTVGFLLLLPPGRRLVKPFLLKWFKNKINNGQFYVIRH